MGAWLDGGADEAIFSTRPYHLFGEGPTLLGCGSFSAEEVSFAPSDFRFTTKGNASLDTATVFAVAMGATKEQTQVLVIQALGRATRSRSSGEVSGVTLLGHGALDFEEQGGGLAVTLPALSESLPPVLAIHGLRDVEWDGIVRQSGDGAFRLPCIAANELSGGAKLGTTTTAGGGMITVLSGLSSTASVQWYLRRQASPSEEGTFEVSILVSSTSNVTLLLDQGGGGAPITLNVPPTAASQFVTVKALQRLAFPAGTSKLTLRTLASVPALKLAWMFLTKAVSRYERRHAFSRLW